MKKPIWLVDLSEDELSPKRTSEECNSKDCEVLELKITDWSELEEDYDSEVSGQAKESLT